ncbi:MAG: amino acid--[acyl-carrier-protein] ligase [Acidimicrobiales bacterium]
MTLQSVLPPPAATDDYDGFRRALLDGGLLHETGTPGVYGYSAAYQRIVEGLDRCVTGLGAGRYEAVHFPPLLVRTTFDRTGYLQSFPDLMGSVHVFRGGDREHRELSRRYEEGGDWPELLEPAEVVLSSAACHSLYPLCSGRLPAGGRSFEIVNWCFRHEPSADPARMVAFRMHELVHVGHPDAAQEHRDTMLAGGIRLLSDLGLPMDTVPANDPFFGRVGSILASAQLEENLKLEGTTPICSEERPTAIISGNCARDHFGEPFGIETDDGQVAHSSCVAFGIDRIALALLHRHDLDPDAWPAEVRRRLRA